MYIKVYFYYEQIASSTVQCIKKEKDNQLFSWKQHDPFSAFLKFIKPCFWKFKVSIFNVLFRNAVTRSLYHLLSGGAQSLDLVYGLLQQLER